MSVTADTPAPFTRPEASQALRAVLAFAATETLGQRFFYGKGAVYSAWGMQFLLAHILVLLAGLLAASLILRRTEAFLPAVTVTFASAAVINPLAWLSVWRLDRGLTELEWLVFLAVQLAPALALLVLVARRRGMGAWRGAVLGAGLVAAHGFAESQMYFEPMFTVEDAPEATGPEIDVEALYAAQEPLMAAQLAALAPQSPGTPEVYALLLGGTAYQSVFRSEVEKAGAILDAQYGTRGRRISLVNSETDPTLYPLANRANLRRSLQALAERIGPEDLAFLFLTSHGSKDLFALSFWQAGTGDLTAAELAAMLRETGLHNVVIVLSACHSGSFLDEIAAPDRLVITAASADRTSFGCADGVDWTEFGRSFFDLALRAEPDPRKAFVTAARDVRSKEFWSLRRASQPQIAEGAAIGPVLDQVLAARPLPTD